MPDYAELQVTTNFSFLRGASHPHELVLTAASLGHRAIGVTDRNSLAGVVRAHIAAKDAGLPLVVGARIDLDQDPAAAAAKPKRADGRPREPDGPSVLCFPTDRAAYGRLSRLITLGRRRGEKGQCWLGLDDLLSASEGQILVALPPAAPDAGFRTLLHRLREACGDRAYLAAHHLYRGDDSRRLARLDALARACRTPLVATNDVHAHAAGRRPLQDALTCVREGCTIDTAGRRLFANAERHLKPPEEMARLFARYPEALDRTVEIAERCRFSLDELRYEYPVEILTPGEAPQETLERLAREGAARRFPDGVPERIADTLAHELRLISELDYAAYFLTVYDIVRFARGQDILCQGRGSAANSVVCYCLGVTSVDPTEIDLLFERFVSAERGEPPDIDVDFEHERREEVIQYIYDRYGRDRAGMTATVVCYRTRGALRDMGKAMGLSLDTIAALTGTIWGWSMESLSEERVREIGLDPADWRLALTLALAREVAGFPRHLSQHVGGFVMTRGALDEVVPIENASMEDRTVIEWDKDDIDALGILKVDVLGLGMLSCIRRAFGLLDRHYGLPLTLATIPRQDEATYEMLCHADSIGVFQVESRAQMSMLPRLKPRQFYDLVIEVAIVRPGPIQGDMVHPYLRRREGKEKVEYPSKELEAVLRKTMGVPLFQEQAMRIAIVGAGFTPSEADRLRRAMATFKKNGDIHLFRDRMIEGMAARGYDRDFAERCFHQIEGFGTYGFPESHAASFALLVYVSAWLKCHYPAAFACALLNSQPMGFYAPAQIVRDAAEHGVEVLPVDVNMSDWDCTLEPASTPGTLALRLGFRQIKGLAAKEAAKLVGARGRGYRSVQEVRDRADLDVGAIERLARADAFRSIGLDRRQSLWQVRRLAPKALPLFAAGERIDEPDVALPRMPLGEHVASDYRTLSLTLKRHPLAFLRESFAGEGVTPNIRLRETPPDTRVRVAGLVLVRQRPGSASGVIFITVEDETAVANLIVWPKVFERFRHVVLKASLLWAEGELQREGEVIHVVVDRLVDRSADLSILSEARLTPPLSRADELVDTGIAARQDAIRAQITGADHVRSSPDAREKPPLIVRSRNFH